MRKRSRWIGILGLLALTFIGTLLFVKLRKQVAEPTEDRVDAAIAPDAVAPEEEVTATEPPIDSRSLAESLADLAGANPELTRWLAVEALLPKMVAAVEAVAAGESPRSLVAFLGPEGRFTVVERDGKEYIDPAGYRRYDAVVGAFVSLDTQHSVDLMKRFRHEIERIHRQIAKPGRTFRESLLLAMNELLRVPAVDGDIPLERIEVTLKIADPVLEVMSQAQKHLFRMGPDNVRKVQVKLRELGRALGMENALYRP